MSFSFKSELHCSPVELKPKEVRGSFSSDTIKVRIEVVAAFG